MYIDEFELDEIEQKIDKQGRQVRKIATYPTNTIIPFGDSISAMNGKGDDIYNNLDAGQTMEEYIVGAKGYLTWANILLNQRLKVLYNAGVSGNTTAQMLARIQTDVINKRPSYCVILGGTNDLSQNVPIETIKNNLLTMYKMLIGSGITVIACTLTPRIITAYRPSIININNFIRSLRSTLKNFIVCDWYEDVASPVDDNWFAGFSDDGLHPIVKSAFVMGKRLYTVLKDIVPVNPIFAGSNTNDATAIFPNMYLLGGATSATGWNLPTTATVIASKVARTNGLEWQQIENTGATATSVKINKTINLPQFVVGTKVSAYLEYEIDASATSITSCSATISSWKSGNMINSSTGLGGYITDFVPTPTSGIIYIPRFTIPVVTGNLDITVQATLIGKFRIGRIRVIVE